LISLLLSVAFLSSLLRERASLRERRSSKASLIRIVIV